MIKTITIIIVILLSTLSCSDKEKSQKEAHQEKQDRLEEETNRRLEIITLMSSGLNKHKEKDYKGAIADANKCIEIDPKNAGCFAIRGNSKAGLKDYRGAIEDYDIAIELDPSGSYYYNRGMYKLNLEQTNNACYDFSKAGELGTEEAYDAIKEYCN